MASSFLSKQPTLCFLESLLPISKTVHNCIPDDKRQGTAPELSVSQGHTGRHRGSSQRLSDRLAYPALGEAGSDPGKHDPGHAQPRGCATTGSGPAAASLLGAGGFPPGASVAVPGRGGSRDPSYIRLSRPSTP